jgi:hypothetical protein
MWGDKMKIFVDRIYKSSDYDDESKWVDYALLTHLMQFISIRNI